MTCETDIERGWAAGWNAACDRIAKSREAMNAAAHPGAFASAVRALKVRPARARFICPQRGRACTAGCPYPSECPEPDQLLAAPPDGWKLVPREPTDEMVAAPHNEVWGAVSRRIIWRAMWDAAPMAK